VQGIFKGGSEGYQLFARIAKGMKGTPMPASEGVYSDEDIWDLIHYVQSLAPAGAQERAQLTQGTFVAPNIHGSLPSGPGDNAWDQARPLYVALTPLWWTDNRIKGLVVKALHNDDELAIRFSWIDPTLNDRAVRQDEFRDAVAIQFSLTSDPPFYMGNPGKNGGVNIWVWKADRQKDLEHGFQDVDQAFPNRVVDSYPEQRGSNEAANNPDENRDNQSTGQSASAYRRPYASVTTHDPTYITAWGAGNIVANPKSRTSVESLVAHGPGTLSAMPANIHMVVGKAIYERGVWSVQMQRSLDFLNDANGSSVGNQSHGDERRFKPGDYLPVSFAIWNGSTGDRDGKKNISIWQKLVIE